MEKLKFDLKIEKVLKVLGFYYNLVGYMYLKFCISIYVQNLLHEQRDLQLTKEIYPACAKHYGCSIESIDRAIRFCVRQCWSFGDVKLQSVIFKDCINFDSVFPSALVVIICVAKYIVKNNEALGIFY